MFNDSHLVLNLEEISDLVPETLGHLLAHNEVVSDPLHRELGRLVDTEQVDKLAVLVEEVNENGVVHSVVLSRAVWGVRLAVARGVDAELLGHLLALLGRAGQAKKARVKL